MAWYTVRLAHLKELPQMKVGDKINYGEFIGYMGSTGVSSGKHLHIDLIKGKSDFCWRQSQAFKDFIPDITELNYFIDKKLFRENYIVTTWIGDYTYQDKYDMVHWGYDIVSDNGEMYWNRSFEGVIQQVDYDGGYGNFVMISYYK